MNRTGGATAPVKGEENRRTLVEIKQEPSDHEANYEETHVQHPADFSEDKPSSSSLAAVYTENSYEFLGHMKYEAVELINLSATEPQPGKKRDICPICQQGHNTRPYYGDHRKRDFVAHLIKEHGYSHLRGYCLRIQCRGCKIKREPWAFVVGEGINYNFSDFCDRCQECACQPGTDNSNGLQCTMNDHRQNIASPSMNFVAHQNLNAGRQECPDATAETPAAVEEPYVLTKTEHLSRKKRDGSVCHLCQQVYYKQTYKGSRKRAFIAHLVKAHHYTAIARCRSCNIEKERWYFVVEEGDNYTFSDECSKCQGNRRSRSLASDWKNFMAHQESNAELQECPEATTETPTAADEPGFQADKGTVLAIIEDPPSKKRGGSVCHLCQQVYCTKTYNGKKRAFIAHLDKAHDYSHLRGHRGFTECRRCGFPKERGSSFLVEEGGNYKFSDECNMSPWSAEHGIAAEIAELRGSREAAAVTLSASEEPPANEAPLLPQQ